MQLFKLISAAICTILGVATFMCAIFSLFKVVTWGLTLAFVTLPLICASLFFAILVYLLLNSFIKGAGKHEKSKKS